MPIFFRKLQEGRNTNAIHWLIRQASPAHRIVAYDNRHSRMVRRRANLLQPACKQIALRNVTGGTAEVTTQ